MLHANWLCEDTWTGLAWVETGLLDWAAAAYKSKVLLSANFPFCNPLSSLFSSVAFTHREFYLIVIQRCCKEDLRWVQRVRSEHRELVTGATDLVSMLWHLDLPWSQIALGPHALGMSFCSEQTAGVTLTLVQFDHLQWYFTSYHVTERHFFPPDKNLSHKLLLINSIKEIVEVYGDRSYWRETVQSLKDRSGQCFQRLIIMFTPKSFVVSE